MTTTLISRLMTTPGKMISLSKMTQESMPSQLCLHRWLLQDAEILEVSPAATLAVALLQARAEGATQALTSMPILTAHPADSAGARASMTGGASVAHHPAHRGEEIALTWVSLLLMAPTTRDRDLTWAVFREHKSARIQTLTQTEEPTAVTAVTVTMMICTHC